MGPWVQGGVSRRPVVLAQKRLLFTDTTMRDAHQSVLATRVRTDDLVRIAPATARLGAGLVVVVAVLMFIYATLVPRRELISPKSTERPAATGIAE